MGFPGAVARCHKFDSRTTALLESHCSTPSLGLFASDFDCQATVGGNKPHEAISVSGTAGGAEFQMGMCACSSPIPSFCSHGKSKRGKLRTRKLHIVPMNLLRSADGRVPGSNVQVRDSSNPW